MVARIRSGKSLKGAVNYNESKVKQGQAALIWAKDYPKKEDNLSFNEKVTRLQQLADLNTRAETNCLHVSLNFDVTEKLSPEKLKNIAEVYMEGIGFGNQPYLVYLHKDAAHPHIHIVSTNIQKDGKRISMHNLGRLQSEKIRKEIEIKFGLVKAGEKKHRQVQPLSEVPINKAEYGKTETKRAITNIVNQVISQYQFSSLPEFNAVLNCYNVMANKGAEGTRMLEKGGLQYSIINVQGEKVGVPVKASSIYGSPTLKMLQRKFDDSKKRKTDRKEVAKQMITSYMKSSTSLTDFINRSGMGGIDVIPRHNADGFIYGFTYVDHISKCVFNGSDLGKELSAQAIRQQWGDRATPVLYKSKQATSAEVMPINNSEHIQNTNTLLDQLTDSQQGFNNQLPYQLRRKKKRKGRKL